MFKFGCKIKHFIPNINVLFFVLNVYFVFYVKKRTFYELNRLGIIWKNNVF